MCVIILPEKGKEVPFDDIKSACIVNPDGFGIAIADRNKLTVIKHYDKKGNNPEKVQKLLEDAKDLPLVLHLRFATKGDKNHDNCHPYYTLKKKDDGIDLILCHNGTFYSYEETDKTKSDTWHLNEAWFKPLFKRFKSSETLQDKLLKDILEKLRPSSSVLTFFDETGSVLTLGSGETMPWGWASNKYSFNRTHREPEKPAFQTPYHNSYPGSGYDNSYYWGADGQVHYEYGSKNKVKKYSTLHEAWQSSKNNQKVVPTTPETPLTGDSLKDPQKDITSQLTPRIPFDFPNKKLEALSAQRPLFIQLANIASLEQVTALEPSDIDIIIEHDPEAARILVMDLIHALYFKGKIEEMKERRKVLAAKSAKPRLDSQPLLPIIRATTTTIPASASATSVPIIPLLPFIPDEKAI